MTLLAIVNDVQDAVGFPRSTVVTTSTDPLVRRVLRWSNAEGKALSKRYGWDILVREHTWSATATEEQTDQIQTDLDRFIDRTFFNRDRAHEMLGPISPRRWQAAKTLTANPLTDAFRIRAGQILMLPVPAAGDTLAYEYISENWCEDSGGAGQSAWADDTDLSRLNEDLIILGTTWRVKKSIGADYAEDFNQYELEVMKGIAADTPKQTIDFSGNLIDAEIPRVPGVPEASWPL